MIRLNGFSEIFTKFPNNETRLDHTVILKAMEQNSEYLFSDLQIIEMKFEDDSDFIKLMFLKNYLDSFNKLVNLNISYFPYSRMDRVEEKSAFTLKYIANFINQLNFNKVYISEAHSNVTTALLERVVNTNISNNNVLKAMNLLGMSEEDTVLFFPDAGAASRYKHINLLPNLIGNKVRNFKTGKIEKLEVLGDVKNPKKVLIIDDLCSFGGTFIQSSMKLKELGFEEVNLFVFHAENASIHYDLLDHINKLVTTDSILDTSSKLAEELIEKKILHII